MFATAHDQSLRRACIVAGALTPVAVVLPPIIWRIQWPFVSRTYGGSYQPIELLGFTFTLVLLIGLAVAIRGRDRRGDEWVPAALFVIAGLWAANQIVEYSARSFDYRCYEAAAAYVRQGVSPYSDTATKYLYPPLLAQVLAGIQIGIGGLAEQVGFSASQRGADFSSDALFYVYQSAQLILLVALFPLLYGLLRRTSMAPVSAAIVVLASLLIDVPITRTLKHNQVNLAVIDLQLIALLYARRPIVSGIAMAIGTHLKIYPLLLAPVFAVFGFWQVLVWWAAAMLPPFLIHGTVQAWRELFTILPNLGQGSFRNNSVFSLTYSAASLSGASIEVAARVARAVHAVGALCATGWMLRRLSQHRRDRSAFLLAGADWIALAVLVSPLAWEHTFVLVLPLLLLAIARVNVERRRLLFMAAVAVFAIPTFDVFPLSYHRLLGVLVIFWLTSPAALAHPGPTVTIRSS